MFHPRRIIHRNRGVRVFVSFRYYDNSNHPSGSEKVLWVHCEAFPLGITSHLVEVLEEVKRSNTERILSIKRIEIVDFFIPDRITRCYYIASIHINTMVIYKYYLFGGGGRVDVNCLLLEIYGNVMLDFYFHNNKHNIKHTKSNVTDSFNKQYLRAIHIISIVLKEQILRRNLLHDARIVGGFRPKVDNYAKYMIFIVKSTGRIKYFGSENFCGGTIITPNYILTAAHCIEGGDIKAIRVIAGTRRRLRRAANVQRRRVQRKILHPDYPQASGCDIALMQLQTKLDIDGKHRAIAPLEFNEYPVVRQHCIAVGWGTIYNNGPCPNDILYVKMLVTSVEPSQIMLHRPSEYAQAACSGDSGGPLFCQGD
uniref:Lectizyme n=1 Tax=Glossina pallidipes TaxID=7398 RepID=A0A1A9Z844_GLOPL